MLTPAKIPPIDFPHLPKAIGAIKDKWLSLGGSKGPLGRPINDEYPTSDKVGRQQNFLHGQMIVWHPEVGAHLIYGAILTRWQQIGADRYGYPITDELGCPDGLGRFNHFKAVQIAGKPESSIYWSPMSGAHEIYGAIRAKWASIGWEDSALYYPTDAEHDRPGGGRLQNFQAGQMTWSLAEGALDHPVPWPTALEPFTFYVDQAEGGRRCGVIGHGFPPRATVLISHHFQSTDGTNNFGDDVATCDDGGSFALGVRVTLVNVRYVKIVATDQKRKTNTATREYQAS